MEPLLLAASPTPSSLSCSYPFLLPDCLEPYATEVKPSYSAWQITLTLFGSVLSFGCLGQLLVVLYEKGNTTQKMIYLLLLFASATFVPRGVDPRGYGSLLPAEVEVFLSPLCTAVLYSIAFSLIVIWSALINRAGVRRRLSTSVLQGIAILYSLATVAVLIVCAVLRAMMRGDVETERGVEEREEREKRHDLLTAESAALSVISLTGTAYFVYIGMLLHHQVARVGRDMKPHLAPRLSLRKNALSAGEEERRETPGGSSCWGRERKKPALSTRILRIVYFNAAMGVSLSAYFFATLFLSLRERPFHTDPYYEYEACLSERKREECTARFPLEVLSLLQMTAILATFIAFLDLNSPVKLPTLASGNGSGRGSGSMEEGEEEEEGERREEEDSDSLSSPPPPLAPSPAASRTFSLWHSRDQHTSSFSSSAFQKFYSDDVWASASSSRRSSKAAGGVTFLSSQPGKDSSSSSGSPSPASQTGTLPRNMTVMVLGTPEDIERGQRAGTSYYWRGTG